MAHPPFKLLSLVGVHEYHAVSAWPRQLHPRGTPKDLRSSTKGWWVADDMRVIFDWGLSSSVVGSSRLEPIDLNYGLERLDPLDPTRSKMHVSMALDRSWLSRIHSSKTSAHNQECRGSFEGDPDEIRPVEETMELRSGLRIAGGDTSHLTPVHLGGGISLCIFERDVVVFLEGTHRDLCYS
ncbi:hypothetical protein DFH09DRAFT_1093214 [Mycena vulgaris]|nr:hypothetical protein DFH09DRAFT_1093214 [Mycena vulgaris]